MIRLSIAEIRGKKNKRRMCQTEQYVRKKAQNLLWYTMVTTLKTKERRQIRARSIVTEMKIKYAFANGDYVEVEVEDKLGKIIEDSRKRESNKARHYRRKNISLEGIVYEGREFSSNDTYFDDMEEKAQHDRIEEIFAELTETQRRRCIQLVSGKSMQQIAKEEGVFVQSVHESIVAVRKKLQKYRK